MISMKRILCIGDSNTYGYDPCSYFGSRYPAASRWPDRLDEWEVVNCGRNGMTVPTFPAPYVDLIQSNSPDLVIVMLGTNDLLEEIETEKTAERMEAFLNAIGKTRIPVLLIAPPPVKPGAWVMSERQVSESRELGELYRKLAAERGIAFADAGEWGIELSFDGVHFTPEGHIAFASKLIEVLSEPSLMERIGYNGQEETGRFE